LLPLNEDSWNSEPIFFARFTYFDMDDLISNYDVNNRKRIVTTFDAIPKVGDKLIWNKLELTLPKNGGVVIQKILIKTYKKEE
jgi:putative hemolysin